MSGKRVLVSVFSNQTRIGRAELRVLDPSNGVYGGPFSPELGYMVAEPAISRLMGCILDKSADETLVQAAFRDRDQLKLQVRTDAGLVFHPAVVHIQDLTRWKPKEVREIHLLGVPWQEAEKVFGH